MVSNYLYYPDTTGKRIKERNLFKGKKGRKRLGPDNKRSWVRMRNWNCIDKGAKTRARRDGRGWEGASGIYVIQ